MTSKVLHHQTPPTRQAWSSGPISTAALVAVLSSVAFIAGFALLSDLSQRESTLSPYTLTVNVLTTLSFAGLAFSIPSLGRVVDVPRWVINTCAAACAAVAAMSWSLVTIAAHYASQVSDDQFMEFTMYLNIFPAPKMVLGLVGFVALGVYGWRRRSVPRGACVLLILAGVLSLWWAYPPATIFAGLAFGWIAKSADASSSD
jgi:hypothetical protein